MGLYDESINPEPGEEEQRTAWDDLIAGLTLLSRSYSDTFGPLHCEHDELWVNANPDHFTAEELAQLEAWGFRPDGEGFKSRRFGSA